MDCNVNLKEARGFKSIVWMRMCQTTVLETFIHLLREVSIIATLT